MYFEVSFTVKQLHVSDNFWCFFMANQWNTMQGRNLEFYDGSGRARQRKRSGARVSKLPTTVTACLTLLRGVVLVYLK